MDSERQAGETEAVTAAWRDEREAATLEILQVISRSRDDEQPVFDMILANAARLCGAPMANLNILDEGQTHLRMVSHFGTPLEHLVAGETTWPLDSALVPATSARERRVIQVEDLADTDLYRQGDPVRVGVVDREGIRTFLAVPLVNEHQTFGCIALYRREVKPFAPDQIELVKTFAQQAVIAIENVRQFRELQTRLEREAATREILEVISKSRDDTMPVFNVILESVRRLCNVPLAFLAIANEDRTHVSIPACIGARPAFAPVLEAFNEPIENSELFAVRAVGEATVVHVHDCADDDLYRRRVPARVQLVEVEGARTILAVPMISNGVAIGALALYRREVAPFTEDEIDLVQSFAAQAVIAIENVRQFRELQTRLEREAATREILQVISRSRDDEQPVFNVILENALRLCQAEFGAVGGYELGDTHLRVVAQRGMNDRLQAMYRDNPPPLDAGQSMAARSILNKEVVHGDIGDPENFPGNNRYGAIAAKEGGIRTGLFVPLLIDDNCVGMISIFRFEVRDFNPEQIALLQTFAAQAAIAVENVRQYKALKAQTEEVQTLNASLENRVVAQVGELERMGRLKRFLSPQVADAVVSAGDEKMLSSHRALIATVFCDIRDFTAFCETAEPEEAIEVLQTYHEAMGRLIIEHNAGVDHRAGDGIMVIFNDPLPCDDPAGDALNMALAMRARMAGLCTDWAKLGHKLGFGVGISLGYATIGMVGSESRYDYTASGTAVNLAARLCDHADDGQILLSPRAYRAVEGRVEVESAGELSLKGIQAPVEVVQVIRLHEVAGQE